uniref:Uncharacterized protein n=1 Tax=uncultured Acidobacteria bacterium HF4000_26D02 TaxID=710731 RepID=E0XW55_9BACT|nr:hypothetical protein [uncultured Acidobacteria bacterium HF4000_26D02]
MPIPSGLLGLPRFQIPVQLDHGAAEPHVGHRNAEAVLLRFDPEGGEAGPGGEPFQVRCRQCSGGRRVVVADGGPRSTRAHAVRSEPVERQSMIVTVVCDQHVTPERVSRHRAHHHPVRFESSVQGPLRHLQPCELRGADHRGDVEPDEHEAHGRDPRQPRLKPAPDPQPRDHPQPKAPQHPQRDRHARHSGHEGGDDRAQCDPPGRPEPRPAVCQHDDGAQEQPDPGVDDEERIAVEPASIERHQQADAVGVEPVQRRVGQHRDVGQHHQPAEPDRSCRRRPAAPDPVDLVHHPREQRRQHRHRQHAMGPAPAEPECQVAAQEVGGGVDVRQVGADDARGGPEPHAADPGLGQAGADERVGQRIHEVRRRQEAGDRPVRRSLGEGGRQEEVGRGAASRLPIWSRSVSVRRTMCIRSEGYRDSETGE